jgi:UDP-glucose 4-epimerase
MRVLVTGAAGFIGSNLVDALLARGDDVVGFDNFVTGFREFLREAESHSRFRIVEGDVLDLNALTIACKGADLVIHLQANADVRFGPEHPDRDLRQNVIATHNVLEAMRLNNVKRIAFSSTGSVYGEARQIPTREDCPFPIQTSLYGASKLAAEGLIQAYAESFGFVADIFRFVSILGPRYTHGHVFDFIRSLEADPSRLHILGDGQQRKSYLHVEDCIAAIKIAIDHVHDRTEIYNLGHPTYCQVTDSAGWICEVLGASPVFSFAGGERGWIGDNPFIHLDISRIASLGWAPRHSIADSIKATAEWLVANPWVFEKRS